MANRNQNHQSGQRSNYGPQGGYGSWGTNRSQDDDDYRYGSRDERDYGSDQGYGNFGQADFGRGNYRSDQSNYSRDIGQDRFGGYGEDTYGQFGNSQSNDGQPNYSYGRPSYGEGQQYAGNRQTSHRGKGPKGYQRSDERIKEMISEKLSDDHEIDASEITVTVQDGRVTLEGTVDSRQTKNAAEDVAEDCGVQDVQNNLRVSRQGDTPSGWSGKSGSTAASSSTGMSASSNESGKQKRSS